MVFAATAVTRGRGRALVTETGERTEVGTIARLTGDARPPATPLQRRLGRLSGVMVGLGLAITVVLTAGMLARDTALEEAFLVGVAVAVAAVPEGLAATVTIALAQGARAMAASGAIVRRLAAVETIGAATVIAADKTGTLTVNRLRIAGIAPSPGHSADQVVEAGVLASSAELLDGAGEPRVAGDPVDGAFVLAASTMGARDPRAHGGRRLVVEIPFDPMRKRQTAAYREADRFHIVVKGAPEMLLTRARLTDEERRRHADEAAAWAAEGLRVLAVAERWTDEVTDDEDKLDADLELVGLVGLHDPLRATAPGSIRRAREAGIKVAILTGDHPVTAAATAAALDLGDGDPVTGAALAAMEGDVLGDAVEARDVFARVTPTDKLRVVEALQARGHVVAVTGDGINDAPALRRADVGVAMGSSGTEAAREAADLVLTDDDFSTIVRAVHEGRRIDANVRKFVAFLLSANLGEVVLFGICVLGGLGAPMTVAQVLVVNLLTDGLPAIALSRDPASPDTMRATPRGRDGLFSSRFGVALASAGVGVGVVATCAYGLGRAFDPGAAQTMAFTTVAVAELALVFSLRSTDLPAWRCPRNATLGWSVLASAFVVALAVYVPSIAESLGTKALGGRQVAIVTGLALLPAVLFEAGKALRRIRRGADGGPIRGNPEARSGTPPMAGSETGAKIGEMTGRTTQSDTGFRAKPGDWVVVHRHTVGEHERNGLILEVLGTPGHERYRVRWDEEHESIFYPGPDSSIRREGSQ
jgi:Ca2+-transporting ATPase